MLHLGDPIWLEDFNKPAGRKQWRPQSYTTSLDAAVTLIADGVEWDATTLYGVARVAVGLNLNEGPHYASHEGGLLPMALCAAALRARAAVSHPEPGAMRSERSERATTNET